MKRFLISMFATAACCFFTLASLAAQSGQMKNAIGMEFVKIPTGEFMMGCSSDDTLCKPDEKPAHKVRITKTIEFGKYEVTQAQYRALAADMDQSDNRGDNNPVEMVTRAEAIAFLDKLTARNDGYKYRLPTEAEWEYAARAGTTTDRYGKLDEIAWWQGNSDDSTHAVGGKKPNAWGLYDMLGNVREWTADTYLNTYYTTVSAAPIDDPSGAPANSGLRGQPGYAGGAGTTLPLIRGGGWDLPADTQRASARYFYFGPTLRLTDLGFRAVREPVAR